MTVLTGCERELPVLAGSGPSERGIAERLFVRPATVVVYETGLVPEG